MNREPDESERCHKERREIPGDLFVRRQGRTLERAPAARADEVPTEQRVEEPEVWEKIRFLHGVVVDEPADARGENT